MDDFKICCFVILVICCPTSVYKFVVFHEFVIHYNKVSEVL